MFHDPKFWLAIAFLIFIGAAIKYALPILLKMIDNKKASIAASIEEANAMRLEAKRLLDEAEKYQRESVAFSEKLIEQAKKESETILNNSKMMVESEIKGKMALAELKIKQEQEKIIRSLKASVVSTAIKAIEESLVKGQNRKASEISSNQAISNISKLIH